MAVVEIAKIQVRRGQENQTGVPRLDPGEFCRYRRSARHTFC